VHNFNRLDLNLLITLDVLLSERNVTRAAARLNLSQPSVSVQLGKLREAFDDPLLLPGPRGMLPTPRADELREPLREALEHLKRVVMANEAFDPASATNTWRVAAADYGELAVLIPTLRHLRTSAPGTRLAVLETNPLRIAKRMEDGEIDLSLQTMDSVPAGLRAQKLFDLPSSNSVPWSTRSYRRAAAAFRVRLMPSLTQSACRDAWFVRCRIF
jgi:DNA-binding transcriptional LysR family regulator